jgi:hypothetical protein
LENFFSDYSIGEGPGHFVSSLVIGFEILRYYLNGKTLLGTSLSHVIHLIIALPFMSCCMPFIFRGRESLN